MLIYETEEMAHLKPLLPRRVVDVYARDRAKRNLPLRDLRETEAQKESEQHSLNRKRSEVLAGLQSALMVGWTYNLTLV